MRKYKVISCYADEWGIEGTINTQYNEGYKYRSVIMKYKTGSGERMIMLLFECMTHIPVKRTVYADSSYGGQS